MTAVPARRPAHGVLLLCGMPPSAVALCRPRTRDPCPHRAVDMHLYRWEPKSSSLEERTAEQRRSQTYGALRQVLRRACLLYHLTSAFRSHCSVSCCGQACLAQIRVFMCTHPGKLTG